MKKLNQSYDVVICSHNDPYCNFGGVEVYNKRLVELFLKNNLKVLYFVIVPAISQENKQKSLCDITYDWNFAFLMAKKAKLCIYSGSLNNKTFIKMFSGLKNSVNIQHSDASYYNRRNEKWKLNLSKTIVCYTNNDNTFISNVIKKKKLHGFNIVPIIIPLDLKPLPKKQNKICKLIYFGRIVKGKGIYFLLKMLSHLNYDIHFYGFIPNYFKFPKKYEKYKSLFFGKYNNKDLPNIIKQYNYTITATNAEGFCIALAESMACSTPIILKNTFQNADFLIDKGKNGFFYDKKASPKKAAKQINAYIENNDWQKTSKNCYEFAKKWFPKENWEKKWMDLYKSFSNSKQK